MTGAAAGTAVWTPANAMPELPVGRAGMGARLRALIELTKPGITRLVVATTAAGFYLGTAAGIDLALLFHTLVGTTLAASGSGALNQYLERGADARMHRTARRPLPSGRLSPAVALAFAASISAAGVVHLMVFVNVTTAAVVAASLLSYILVYTPLKRRTSLNTVVGAVPGALPVLAGWTASGTALDGRALALFGILFLWQMPHFFSLAWIYREDYVRGGFRMITESDPSGARTARRILMYTALLLAVSLLPNALGMTSGFYLAGASLLGGAFLVLAAALHLRRDERRAWHVFLGSVIYLPALLMLLVLDKALT